MNHFTFEEYYGKFQLDKAFDFSYVFKSIVTRWYLYLALAVVISLIILFAVFSKHTKRNNLSKTQSFVYVAVLTAVCVVANVLQIPIYFVQISLVATVCFIAGVLLGPVKGFVVGFVGDLIAGIIAPMGVYSPVIGVSTGLLGFIPGFIFAFFKGKDWVRAIISFIITFLICSVVLNTLGLCLIYPKVYVLLERVLDLPFTFAAHSVNCGLSILLLKRIKKTSLQGKFAI